ncbi:hypothetical protein BpHYR1_000034 [Brachionus plicatilis]|uniref:Uncharacterized protein n=1 Tax=Brachionus plicatilis TaxID=10195 RepID=A0A3M7QJ88_BRAPC|nr:hypothetical protein BpHYR1_000034 [Brachionus plicatilis]
MFGLLWNVQVQSLHAFCFPNEGHYFRVKIDKVLVGLGLFDQQGSMNSCYYQFNLSKPCPVEQDLTDIGWLMRRYSCRTQRIFPAIGGKSRAIGGCCLDF